MFIILLCLIFNQSIFASAFVTSRFLTSSGEVNFDAIGNPKKLLIHGKSTELQGHFQIDKNMLSGVAVFDLSSLETGMALRDRHMKEKYLEVEKFKTATLILNPLDLGGSTFKDLQDVKFSGKLNLHGVQNPVEGVAKIKMHVDSGNLSLTNMSSMSVDADFSVNTNDYKISTPSFAGLTVAEEVKIKVKFEAKLEKKPN